MSSILDNPAVRQVALPVSVEQYHRLGEAGIIAEKTELLRGVIVEKMIKSPDHSWMVQWLVDWLRSNLPAGVHVRQEQPLTLEDSEPEPDVAVVTGAADDYRKHHPRTASLVIEVAVSSADVDRAKASLYAAAGVTEYLIVLASQKSIEGYTQPNGTVYSQQARFDGNARLALRSFPGLSFEVGQLFW